MKNLLTILVRANIIINVRARTGGDILSPAGRPKADNPKNIRLEIRLTQGENQLLEECAEKLCTTKTEVINKGIALVKKELDKK